MKKKILIASAVFLFLIPLSLFTSTRIIIPKKYANRKVKVLILGKVRK